MQLVPSGLEMMCTTCSLTEIKYADVFSEKKESNLLLHCVS